MTKNGQTEHYKASDHIRDLEKYIGRSIDYFLINNAQIPKEVVKHYQESDEEIVVDDLGIAKTIFRLDLLSKSVYNKTKEDTAQRSLLRHDSAKIAKALVKIMK
jgi:2-phospho-L-lactate transferase/gluconeogenesis factor (CofD/UPF0052 family)